MALRQGFDLVTMFKVCVLIVATGQMSVRITEHLLVARKRFNDLTANRTLAVPVQWDCCATVVVWDDGTLQWEVLFSMVSTKYVCRYVYKTESTYVCTSIPAHAFPPYLSPIGKNTHSVPLSLFPVVHTFR